MAPPEGSSAGDGAGAAAGPTPADRPDFDEIRGRLLVSVRRVCPGWLADRAEDIVQDAMLRVLDVYEKIEHAGGPPSSYLWKVAYSATVDEIRRARRRRENPAEVEQLERSGPVDPDGPYRATAGGELGDAVDACLRRLIDSRRLIVAFYLLGHDLAESEQLSGWGAKRVRNLLYRGLADLRQCLTAKGFTP